MVRFILVATLIHFAGGYRVYIYKDQLNWHIHVGRYMSADPAGPLAARAPPRPGPNPEGRDFNQWHI